MGLKYYNYDIVMAEVPDEVTLAINITNCPCRCKGCHSTFLWDDVGEELTTERLLEMINNHAGITCVAFMGGDSNPGDISKLAESIPERYNIKRAWYSGFSTISPEVNILNFEYIKLGPYDAKYGPIDKRTTNQVMYKRTPKSTKDISTWENITFKFWKL